MGLRTGGFLQNKDGNSHGHQREQAWLRGGKKGMRNSRKRMGKDLKIKHTRQ